MRRLDCLYIVYNAISEVLQKEGEDAEFACCQMDEYNLDRESFGALSVVLPFRHRAEPTKALNRSYLKPRAVTRVYHETPSI